MGQPRYQHLSCPKVWQRRLTLSQRYLPEVGGGPTLAHGLFSSVSPHPSHWGKPTTTNLSVFTVFENKILYLLVFQKPIFLYGTKSTPEDVLARVKEVYGFLEAFLQEQDWLVGDRTTLADIQCITTVTSLDHFVPIEAEVFPKVTKWIARCQKLPYYGPNQEGMDKFKAMVTSLLNRNA